jgi:ribose 5-phosphate isomerase B
MQKISIASDHNGVALKNKLIQYLKDAKKYEVVDFGSNNSEESVDYSDYAKKVCESILDGDASLGVLICGAGIGMSIASNRYSGIRAALCTNLFMSERARAHNDANILVLGSRISSEQDSINMLQKFLDTTFEGGRHARRLSKIS